MTTCHLARLREKGHDSRSEVCHGCFVCIHQCSTRRAAAIVEFALIAPLFLLLFLGIVEMGRLLMVQGMLVNAAREGARQATLPLETDCASDSDGEQLYDGSRDLGLHGNTVAHSRVRSRVLEPHSR